MNPEPFPPGPPPGVFSPRNNVQMQRPAPEGHFPSSARVPLHEGPRALPPPEPLPWGSSLREFDATSRARGALPVIRQGSRGRGAPSPSPLDPPLGISFQETTVQATSRPEGHFPSSARVSAGVRSRALPPPGPPLGFFPRNNGECNVQHPQGTSRHPPTLPPAIAPEPFPPGPPLGFSFQETLFCNVQHPQGTSRHPPALRSATCLDNRTGSAFYWSEPLAICLKTNHSIELVMRHSP